jgi:hypothetical protein
LPQKALLSLGLALAVVDGLLGVDIFKLERASEPDHLHLLALKKHHQIALRKNSH